MKILVSSHAFTPSVGGIETASKLLAPAFQQAGHEVLVVTQTAGEEFVDGVRVLRRPTARTLYEAVQWCEICWHNNLSLRAAWPLVLLRRPWVVTTQTWLDHGGALNARWKRLALRFASNVSISQAVADTLKTSSLIIGNPYDSSVFYDRLLVRKPCEIVFVGRLVSDKGLDMLLEAMASLQKSGLRPRLTVIGSGPEMGALQNQVEHLDLGAQVCFAGALQGDMLASELSRHQILVVPSRWAEPFGIVALEGVACGCVVLGSAGGGLPEAIGPCGTTFPNGDVAALASKLSELLANPEWTSGLRSNAPAHLAGFTVASVAARYLSLFSQMVGKGV